MFNTIFAILFAFIPIFLIGLAIGYFGGFESKESSAIANALGLFFIGISLIGNRPIMPVALIGYGCAIYGGIYF